MDPNDLNIYEDEQGNGWVQDHSVLDPMGNPLVVPYLEN